MSVFCHHKVTEHSNTCLQRCGCICEPGRLTRVLGRACVPEAATVVNEHENYIYRTFRVCVPFKAPLKVAIGETLGANNVIVKLIRVMEYVDGVKPALVPISQGRLSKRLLQPPWR